LNAAKGAVDMSAAAGARNYVLVHGAWHGGWCYARVAEALRSGGHRVFTPTLTGLGERSHLADLGEVGLGVHIRDVANVIRWEQLDEVILCGHSYGGLVAGGVADAMPERIASLVYLDAIIPDDGKCMLDYLEPGMAAAFAAAAAANGGVLPPIAAAALGVNRADEAWVDALCTPHPFASYTERQVLSGAYLGIAKIAYVRAAAWAGAGRQTHYQRAKDAGWALFDVAGGHDLMLDAPNEVARILLEAA
jgi:pimeloyl-ACP methyl ester carboxylesterase